MDKVDVLAVMDQAANWCASKSAVSSDLGLRKARAVIAELVEATGTYEEAVRVFGVSTPTAHRAYERLVAALAIVRGAA